SIKRKNLYFFYNQFILKNNCTWNQEYNYSYNQGKNLNKYKRLRPFLSFLDLDLRKYVGDRLSVLLDNNSKFIYLKKSRQLEKQYDKLKENNEFKIPIKFKLGTLMKSQENFHNKITFVCNGLLDKFKNFYAKFKLNTI